MKQVLIASVIALMAMGSCAQRGQRADGQVVNDTTGSGAVYPDAGTPPENSEWERLVMVPFKDAKGTVVVEMPFPSSWKLQGKVQSGQPHITGPKGTRVIDYPLQTYTYPTDPQLQQIYLQSGQPMRPMPGSIDELIREEFLPWGERSGLRFVSYEEIPEIARIDNWYDDQLFKVSPPKKQIHAIGTEWQKDNGDPFFLLIRLNATEMMGTLVWSYWCSSLESTKGHYGLAKKQLIFAMANAHYNPEPIMEYNRMEAQKVNQSWAAFNNRMAANQAAFQAQQRDFVNRSNAVNDAIMGGWRESNAASDAAHERFVDGITERTNTYNSATGTHQKVESGYNQYWMNSDGKYISTNSHTYDPNLDEVLNKQQWDKLEAVKR